MSRHLHLRWFSDVRATIKVAYDLDADLLGTGGDTVETVRRLTPHGDVYAISREAGTAIPAAGGTALLRHHLPIVTFFVTDHYTDPQEDIDNA